ncbi:bifunctional biotin--[acetyl-CoA-carboxylase] ligase/biotin operon repressor BirA [Gallibacterium melopsittaci]|uniref:biotin--[biotin carboxyl-carrier protein] ligase n=1 Tax=Gallibacterium melopsittaci TaxID=516063 RepID=A0ABV6HVK9_9PAST
MNIALLNLLADGQVHSYPELSQALAITLSTVTEQIVELQQQGVQLVQKDETCQWLPATELLDGTFLQQTLPNNALIIQPVIDSTNQYLLDRITTLPNNSVCLAEYQTAGRGRRGRKWHSPFAGQVILSFYRQFPNTVNLSGLSLAIGIAVAQALTHLGYQQVQLKWPNDIWLAGKKLGGILIEMKQQAALARYDVVIGLGLNVHFPADIQLDQPIAMLSQQKQLNRNAVIAEIIKQFNQVLDQFTENGLSFLLPFWQQYDYFYQKEVKLLLENKTVTGVDQGVNANGELCLQREDGSIITFAIGEVSLREK